ncbi:MAG: hypothetical protein U1F66_12655 [bacterium]
MRCLNSLALRFCLFLVCGASLALLPGCSKQAAECRQVEGLGGKIHLGVPGGWEEIPELHASADIEVGNREADAYLLVVSERKAILPKQSLEEYSEFTRAGLARSLDFPEQLGPRRIKIGGLPALQYQIRAISKSGQRLVYLHTSAESPEYFHQIVGWTRAENFKRDEPVMKSITESFREGSAVSPGDAGAR